MLVFIFLVPVVLVVAFFMNAPKKEKLTPIKVPSTPKRF